MKQFFHFLILNRLNYNSEIDEPENDDLILFDIIFK